MNLIETLFVTITLSVVSAILYRAGGSGDYNTKARDIGVPLCMVAWMAFNHSLIWWVTVPSFLLMFGAQTTYFKKKGENATLINWIAVGLAFSLCMLPYAFYLHNWSGFLIRLLVVTLFTAVWSQLVGKDIWEERGRGFIQIATLPWLFV